MSTYRIFILAFIISTLALFGVMFSYFQAIIQMIGTIQADHQPQPQMILRTVFSPLFITSLALASVCGLLYRILGIVAVARNSTLEGGEKALWIVGFALLGFITAIVFMCLAKSKKMFDTTDTIPGANDKPAFPG